MTEREVNVTVVVTFHADEASEPERRGELTDRLVQLAEDFGADVAIFPGHLREAAEARWEHDDA